MKVLVAAAIVVALALVSCGKKEGSDNLNPLNAAGKYGEVMNKAMQKAKNLSSSSDQTMYINNKINVFRRQFGRYPNSLDELVEKEVLDKVPPPPQGMKYQYDPATGKLSVVQQ